MGPDYAALRAVLESEFAGQDDAAICAALNAPVTVPQDVRTADAREVLLATGEFGALDWLATMPPDGTPIPVIIAAKNALAALTRTETLRVADPDRWAAAQGMFEVLGPGKAGIWSAATLDALAALRLATTTRAQQMGFLTMDEDLVRNTRSA